MGEGMVIGQAVSGESAQTEPPVGTQGSSAAGWIVGYEGVCNHSGLGPTLRNARFSRPAIPDGLPFGPGRPVEVLGVSKAAGPVAVAGVSLRILARHRDLLEPGADSRLRVSIISG